MATLMEALAIAVSHHQAGRLDAAEQIYRQILQAEPDHADARHLLGVAAHQAGRHALAVECIGRAIALRPDEAHYHHNLGTAYRAMGRFDEAAACYRRALELEPDRAEAHQDLGDVLQEQGQPAAAVDCYQRALQLRPDYPQACHNLGTALLSLGQLDRAADCYRRVLARTPDDADAHYNLANVLQGQRQFEAAIAAYRRALELRPGFARAWNNLGHTWQALEKLAAAVDCYRQALRLDPDLAEAHSNLGHVCLDQGRLPAALEYYRRARELRPAAPVTHNDLGCGLLAQGDLGPAVACFRRALELDPRDADAHQQLATAFQARGKLQRAMSYARRAIRLQPGLAAAHLTLAGLLAQQGRFEEALARYDQALRIEPSGRNRYLRATCLPVVYRSWEQIHATRRELLENLGRLRDEGIRFDPRREMLNTVFDLAYQGLDDREIHSSIARLWRDDPAAIDSPPRGARGPGEKIHLGLVSASLRNHTIGHLWRGLIAQLSREKFSVSVLSLGPATDAIAAFIRRHADHYQALPANLAAARQAIAAAGLDVLYYPDIGMVPLVYSLARARLAPVQCVAWGHPVTTGLPSIDYFVSSALLESPGADAHYTEKLVRLKTLGLYVYRPEVPRPAKSRGDFGLPEDRHLYACLQSLQKFHPAFDAVLAEILRRDPQGLLLVPAGHAHCRKLLRERFRATAAGVAERICWIPWQTYDDYLRLLALAEVSLVPTQFGGGRTSYDALALGVPAVTLPSPYLRGRITYGLYRAMDLPDCVARTEAEYVEIAVRLATDAGYREAIRAKILAANGRLFEDREAVRDLEQFLVGAVEQSRPGA
jgi:tetratricopeptide (TPR) repeat protein